MLADWEGACIKAACINIQLLTVYCNAYCPVADRPQSAISLMHVAKWIIQAHRPIVFCSFFPALHGKVVRCPALPQLKPLRCPALVIMTHPVLPAAAHTALPCLQCPFPA